MKSVILVVIISVLHFFISIWLSIKSFGHAFSFFDTGRELTIIEKINYWAVEILFFPIITIIENTSYEDMSGLAQYIPFILNSMLWGILIVFGFKLIFKRNK